MISLALVISSLSLLVSIISCLGIFAAVDQLSNIAICIDSYLYGDFDDDDDDDDEDDKRGPRKPNPDPTPDDFDEMYFDPISLALMQEMRKRNLARN